MPDRTRVLLLLNLRLAWRPAAAWALAFAAIVLTSALAYAGAFPDLASRARLQAALAADRGIAGLFGAPVGTDHMAGFVQWRSTVLLGTIGAVWAVLTVARLLREAEDDGQAELLGAQPLRRGSIAATGLAAALALTAGIGAAVWLAAVGGGLPVGPSALFACTLVMPATVFGALAAVIAQVAPDRGLAAAWGGGAVALAFALRVVADSDASLRWLSALTPLGWAQRVHPLTDPHAGWLLLGAAVAAAAGALAVGAAARRDLGAAVWMPRARRRRGARSLTTLGASGALPGWAAGVSAFCFITGTVSASVGSIARAGGSHDRLSAQVFTPRGYLTTVLLLVSTLVAVYGARAAARAHEEEASGRLALVLAGGGARRSWLAGRLARGLAGAAALLVLAGVAAWLGARSRGIDLSLGALAGAGAAALPTVAVFTGAATLALGLAPRLTGAVAAGASGVMLLLQVVGQSLHAPGWVTWLSPFAHQAQAPLDPVRAAPVLGLSLVAIALLAAGTTAFVRRDLGGP